MTASYLAEMVTASGALLRLEIAHDAQTQEHGLSGRDDLPEDLGMVFWFPRDVQFGFWMTDTHVPLSVACLSAAGRVLGLFDMAADSRTIHVPDQPFRYAVEANQGWFERNEVRAGDRITLRWPEGFEPQNSTR